jgi:chitodextrinase
VGEAAGGDRGKAMAEARGVSGKRHCRASLTAVLILVILLLAFILPAASATAAVASSLRRYPYLSDLVQTNVTVNWATTTAVTTGSVTYGLDGSEACSAHQLSATRTSITVGSTAEYQWKAELSGLQPDARYCYRVFGDTSDLLGTDPSPTFATQLPAGSTSPFSFAVFGDWGKVGTDGTNPDQARLMSQVASSGARFAVTTGDNGYNSGTQTEYGDLVQTGSGTGGIFGPSFWAVPGRSIPLFMSQGNHGMNSVGLTNFPQDRAAASSSGAFRMETYCCVNNTSSASYPSLWYAFDAGPARFYVLEASWANSNVGSSDLYGDDYAAHWTPTSPEYQWLAADLAAHPTALKFAFFHFPLYSANSTESSDTWLQGPNSLEGLLAANGVDIVFNGHAHIYARGTPSSPGMPVTYLTGGGGADLEPVSRCGAPIAAAIGWSYSSAHGSSCGSLSPPTSIDQVFHFLLVTVDGSQVTVTPTDEMGRTFDVQTYTFGTSTDTEAPTAPTGLTASASGGGVDLAWTASTDNVGVTGYRILRDGVLIGTVGATTSDTDATAAPATTYSYTVKAVDAAGNVSAASDPAVITTPSGGGGGGGTLTFTPTDDAYVVQGSPSSNYGAASSLQTDGSPIKDFLMKFNVSGVGSATVTSAQLALYVVDPSSSGGVIHPTTSSTWSEGSVTWSNAPPPATSPNVAIGAVSTGTWMTIDVTTLVNGDGVVSLRVNSSNSNGADYASKEGGTSTVPTLRVTTSGSGGTTDTQAPTAPTDLVASASNGSVGLTWTAASDDVGVTGYRILRDNTSIDTVGPVTSYTDTTVQPSTTYSYTVVAFDAAGNTSSPSAPAVVTTPGGGGGGGGTLTFTPTDDAYIVQGSPSTNYGAASSLQTDGSPIKDFLMKFDVSGVGSATVTSAQLRLYVVDPSPSGGTIRPTVNASWAEGTVTWSTAPSVVSSPSVSIGKVTKGTWVTIDVTALVAGDGTLSIRVSSASSNGADYASKEGGVSTRPELIVTTS